MNVDAEKKKVILKRAIIELVLFALLLISDLVSKDLVMNRLGLSKYKQYTIVEGVFAIYPCLNDGASFSAFAGKTGFLIALTSIMTLALMALAVFNLIKKPKTSMLFRWALVLIIAGAVGNLYDRIFCDGMVRDFIKYIFLDSIFDKLFDSSFGIGNIADIYLVLGVFLMCGYIIFDYKEGDLGILKSKKVESADGENPQDSESNENNAAEDEDCVKSTDIQKK
ncbi:MAG: signal peptidase II [Clostridia bacterium]|nr:signal peptidase II [Clostridia bacterium]